MKQAPQAFFFTAEQQELEKKVYSQPYQELQKADNEQLEQLFHQYVPEPGTLLIWAGLLGLGLVGRRRIALWPRFLLLKVGGGQRARRE